MGLSSREIGEKLGVSHTAINKAARRGRIQREPDGTFDLEKVRAAWVENADQHQRSRGLATAPAIEETPKKPSRASDRSKRPAIETLQQAQVRKESAVADLRELEYRKTVGELLASDEVEQEWSALISAVRNRFLLLPAKVAAKMASLSDARECQAVLEREIREVLKQLAEEDGTDEK